MSSGTLGYGLAVLVAAALLMVIAVLNARLRQVRRRAAASASQARTLEGERARLLEGETRLRAREAALVPAASIVEWSADAIVGVSAGATIQTWNAGAERLYGYAAREVLGRPAALLFPADRSDELKALTARLERGEPVDGVETVRVTKDGRLLEVAVTLSALRDAGGAFAGVASIDRDVGERRRTERRLTAQYAAGRALSEATSLAEAAPQILKSVGQTLDWTAGVLWIADAGVGVLRCAEAWHATSLPDPAFDARLRGTTLAPGDGVPGRAWLTRAPVWVADVHAEPDLASRPGTGDHLRGAFAFPVRGNSAVLGVIEFRSREPRPADPDVLLLAGTLGHQIGQFIERRKAELAVREDEALKSAILETSLDGIVTLDHEGKVLEFNGAATRIFGYARPDAVGRALAELIIPPALREQYRTDFARSASTGEGQVIGQQTEMTAMRADGSEFPVELAIVRLPLPFPRPPIFTAYVRDITERKRAEAAERSAEALRSVARLANAAGHEINNPLTVIITSLEILGKDLESGPVSPTKVKPILAAAERIRDVIAHMRRMTRLELVNREPHLPEMLDLRESSPASERSERARARGELDEL